VRGKGEDGRSLTGGREGALEQKALNIVSLLGEGEKERKVNKAAALREIERKEKRAMVDPAPTINPWRKKVAPLFQMRGKVIPFSFTTVESPGGRSSQHDFPTERHVSSE